MLSSPGEVITTHQTSLSQALREAEQLGTVTLDWWRVKTKDSGTGRNEIRAERGCRLRNFVLARSTLNPLTLSPKSPNPKPRPKQFPKP